MLVSIAEHIGVPIGATTCPLRVTATTHTAVGEIAVTIQRTSGSATADSGGITDSLTRRGGHAEGAPAFRIVDMARSPARRICLRMTQSGHGLMHRKCLL